MTEDLSGEILELLTRVLSGQGVGAELETRRVQRGEVSDPSEVVINVLPDNCDSAAALQLHVDGRAVDLTLGNGTVLEYLALDSEGTASLISQLAEITSAVASGNFRERVRRRKGKVGFARGEIHTRSGVIRSKRYDFTVGWLFAPGETIRYVPFAAGTVRVTEGPAISLPAS